MNEVERSILGSDDPEGVWRHLCPEAVECFFFEASVGAVFGLVVHGGARVALKVHRGTTAERLTALQEVQEHLWRYGFPCPRPLGVRGHATLEEWRDDGVIRDAHRPDVRRALAALLARLVTIARSVQPSADLPPFFPRAGGALWPQPHNVLFDFDATASGAEWIDEIARTAKERRDRGEGNLVIGHHDWTAKHVRFAELRPTVVYDWDSVSVDREPIFVGEAAAHFTYEAGWPSVDEALLFMADYERARPSPFTREEQATASAAAVYARAYTTRCVHALGDDTTQVQLDEYAAELLQ